MESEFEPSVQMEETPEARIVIVHLPGFRKENLKVQIDNWGNLIISGERGGKEIEEMTKVGGRLEETHRFRKVIAVPDNLNIDARITAKFMDQTLRISLPLLHISYQEKQNAIPAGGKPDQLAESKDESSSVAQQQDSLQKRSAVAQDDQRARHPEAIRQDDDKASKGGAAAEESKGLVEDRKTEAPKHGRDFVHGEPPLSKAAMQERPDDQSARHPEAIRPDDQKAKPIAATAESKELAERDQSVESNIVERSRPGAGLQEDSMKERSRVAQDDERAGHPEAIRQDDDKAKGSAAAEESRGLVEDRKTEAPKMTQDFLDGEPPLSKDAQVVSTEAGGGKQSQIIQSKSKQHEEKQQQQEADDDEEAAAEDKGEGEGEESSLPSANDEFPEKIIQIIPTSTRRSLFFTRCCNVL